MNLAAISSMLTDIKNDIGEVDPQAMDSTTFKSILKSALIDLNKYLPEKTTYSLSFGTSLEISPTEFIFGVRDIEGSPVSITTLEQNNNIVSMSVLSPELTYLTSVVSVITGKNTTIDEFSDIEGTDRYNYLYKLATAKYLMTVGKKRSTFVLDGFPAANDGEQMKSDGKDLYEQTIEELKEEMTIYFV